MTDCCLLVGNFPIGKEGIINVSISSKTESQKVDGELIVGPTVGSVSLTGYATNRIHRGCAGRAGVSINWMRRYDCDKDEVHFIFAGEGASFIYGDINGLANIHNYVDRSYNNISADAGGGPTGVYTIQTQEDGYGLSFNGDPYSFSTKSEGGAEFSDFLGIGCGSLYLQSFNLTTNPGSVPTASYSFVFTIGQGSN